MDIDFCVRSTEGRNIQLKKILMWDDEDAIHIHRISKRYSDVLELTGFISMHTPL